MNVSDVQFSDDLLPQLSLAVFAQHVSEGGAEGLCKHLSELARAAGEDEIVRALTMLRAVVADRGDLLARDKQALFHCVYDECALATAAAVLQNTDDVPVEEGGVGVAESEGSAIDDHLAECRAKDFRAARLLEVLAERWLEERRRDGGEQRWLRQLRVPDRKWGTSLLARGTLTVATKHVELSFDETATRLVVEVGAEAAAAGQTWNWLLDEWSDALPARSLEVEPSSAATVYRVELDDQCGAHLVRAEDGQRLQSLSAWNVPLLGGAVFSKDGRWLAIREPEDYEGVHIVSLWRLQSDVQTEAATLQGRWGCAPHEPVAFAGGEWLQTGNWFRALDGDERMELGFPDPGRALLTAAICTERDLVALLDADGLVEVHRLRALEPAQACRPARGHVGFSRSGGRLYVQPHLYDGDHGCRLCTFDDPLSTYLEGGPPDHSHLVGDRRIVSMENGWVRRADDGTPEAFPKETFGLPDSTNLIAYSRDEQLVAVTAPVPAHFLVHSFDTGECVLARKTAPDVTGLRSIAIDFEGKLVAVGARNGDVAVYELPTGELRWRGNAPGAEIVNLLFDLGSRMLISGSHMGTVTLWDANNGREIAVRTHAEEPALSGWRKAGIGLTEREMVAGWNGFETDINEVPWVALVSSEGTEVVERQSKLVVARHPNVQPLIPHPKKPIWANHEYILRLEEL